MSVTIHTGEPSGVTCGCVCLDVATWIQASVHVNAPTYADTHKLMYADTHKPIYADTHTPLHADTHKPRAAKPMHSGIHDPALQCMSLVKIALTQRLHPYMDSSCISDSLLSGLTKIDSITVWVLPFCTAEH